MLVRRGLGRLLQASKLVTESCSQQTQTACLAAESRAGLHCISTVLETTPEPGSRYGERSQRDRFSGGFNQHSLPWSLPQTRLASSSPADLNQSSDSGRDETLEGSELPPDVQPGAGESSFSPETTAEVIPQVSGAAGSSLDATSVLDAVSMAEADAVASALENVWPLTAGMQSLLLGLHSASGLPWWGIIALTTVGARLITAPLTLMQIRNTYRMTQARPEMEKIAAYMKSEGATNPQASTAAQERMAQVWIKYDCNPMKSLVGVMGQAFVFMTFFFALKSLSAAKVPSLVNGGALWFTDLTSADPYYGLPILTGAFMLGMVQLNAAEGMQGQSPTMIKNFKIGMSVLAVAIIPFSYLLPKSVFIYWIVSNVMVACQNTALKLPAVKKYFKIPELKRTDTQASFDAAASVVKTYREPPQRKAK